MTSYELLDFYNEILQQMQSLNAYTNELSKLLDEVSIKQNNLLSTIYQDSFSNINNSNAIASLNDLKSKRNSVIAVIQNFAMNFDVLGNYQRLLDSRKSIEDIFKKYEFGLKEEKDKILSLLSEYNSVTKIIFEYIKTKSNSIIVELLNKITLIVNKYNDFISTYQNINNFMSKTENEIEIKENEKIFEIQFYDEQINPEYFTESIQAVRDSYEIMCQISNVSTTEHKLKVVKIESGSLFIKVIGDALSLGVLEYLMKKIINLIFNKFTFEGQVLRSKQILDLIKEDTEVASKYKELGLNIEFGENINKLHFMLVKSIKKLIGQTTKVKIDKEKFYLKDILKQKYLTESKMSFLEESKKEEIGKQAKKEDK